MASGSLPRRRFVEFVGFGIVQGTLCGCTGRPSPRSTDGKRVMAKHLLSLDDLRAADAEARKRFQLPYWCDPGLGALGLILDKNLDDHRYSTCTPINCKTFAGTGGEGIHFSLLEMADGVSERSPVVISNPGAMDGRSWVVGENLFDFLCLGFYRGYFALEQLSYYLELTLEVYTNPNWMPRESWHDSVGYVLADEKRPILDFLISRFSLQPWVHSDRFDELQNQYGRSLKLPREPLD